MEEKYLEVDLNSLLEAYWRDLKRYTMLTIEYDGLELKIDGKTYQVSYRHMKE